MSANPQNANPGLRLAGTASERRQNASSGREALQALLAFSALQEQIRRRRAAEAENIGKFASQDAWQPEQFVLDEVLHLVAERAQAITGADGVAIALASGEAVVCRASVGLIVPDPGVQLNPNSGFSGICFRSGEIARCDDAENDPRVNVQICRRLGANSMVAVPLLARKNVIGLIEAFSTEAYAFNDSDVRSLSLLAELILAAIRPEEEDRMAEISRQVSAGSSSVVVEQEHKRDHPEASTENSVSSAAKSDAEPRVQFSELASFTPELVEPEFLAAQPGTVAAWKIVVLLVLGAAVLGGGAWWWMVRQRMRPATLTKPASVAATQPALDSAVPTSAKPAAVASVPPVSLSSAQTSGPTEVMDIRHWSSGDTTTVAIDLQSAVQYDAHRLTGPDRIYFDLYDTFLAPNWSGKIVDVAGPRLARIRVAQLRKGVTRVVLETNGTSSFSVSLQQNPYRLIVEVGKAQVSTNQQSSLTLSNSATAGATKTKVKQARAGLRPFTIVLDPGHGGWDLGSVGQGGLLEKNLVLDIAKRLGKLIQARLHAEVIYTRQNDMYVSLERRAEIANLDHADLFVAVHANYSSSPTARGVETYYSNTYSSVHARTPDADAAFPEVQPVNWANVDIRQKAIGSQLLARNIQTALYDSLAAKNPNLPDRGVKEASYAVLVGTTMPAVLAEVSFVSSPRDEQNLHREAYRQKIAEALYTGIAGYVKHTRNERLTSLSKLSSTR